MDDDEGSRGGGEPARAVREARRQRRDRVPGSWPDAPVLADVRAGRLAGTSRGMNKSPRWPWVLTVLIVAGAAIIFWFPPDGPRATRAANVGDFLSGVAGALAFVWLIA